MSTKIRRVSASDRTQILEISRHIWEGHDYLPSVINSWFEDPNSYTFGIETDKRLVAVNNLRIIENGQTGWMEGLRVHPDYRGKGFANILTEHIIKKAIKKGVHRLRYTTGADNSASIKLAQKFGFLKVNEMGVFWHPNPKIMSSKIKQHQIIKSTPDEVYRLIQNSPHIMPRVLFYDWKALNTTLESINTIGKSHEFCVILKKKVMTSLSYGYIRLEEKQKLWAFTIYASEPTGFLAHLFHNITEASRKNFNSIMGTYETNFEHTLQNINWTSHEYWTIQMILLEKIINQN